MRIALLACFILLIGGCTASPDIQADNTQELKVAAERPQAYLPKLQGKRVGLVVNQTSKVGDSHLVDYLLDKSINVARIFAPEHGFRGDHDAGAHVNSEIDAATGIPITSIYGKFKKPPVEMLQQLDVVVFDIQDVGVRFYTYISSMHYMMEAAAEAGIQFMVLDRPNPNGRFVDGPILEPEFRSFVGMHPIPILHGMTVAELAQMIKGEGWINQAQALDLVTVPVANYTRKMPYSLPVAPSPNLPNDQGIGLYPSLCFFEATPISVGRGTDFPFQVIGFDDIPLGEFAFSPESRPGSALHPKLEGKQLLGIDLRDSTKRGLDLTWLVNAQQQFAEHDMSLFTRPDFMDKLAGTDALRKAIEAGQSSAQIKQSWQAGLAKFSAQRQRYLLYP
ncbi:DUF1343 domain-containing protein [Paraglaciecola agarilytica]|uniref:exo-beta-N-acetylmuramidase NamZ family protein n=1 Tax=Paraglaciecola chathamensis TaxID=368405 RepID=UPI001C08AD75|nr:DUF1343 domain-containing protein [Paraglaciecola agarilytica]MBU3017890.1 DUF1343 domain-containing protein [Paraglaciecola agarilytica]